ncbi:MAG: protein serine/threonine phosphatase [Capsulimonas sp.]|nr:protein serine/threonine phosphatase [Capsulimonas sp.]
MNTVTEKQKLETASFPDSIAGAAPDDSEEQSRPGIRLLFLNLLLLGSIFFADVYQDEHYHVSVLYNVCIALTLWSWRPRWTMIVTIAAMAMRVISHLNDIQLGTDDTYAFNLFVGLFVQALTGGLIWRQIVVQQRLEAHLLLAGQLEKDKRRQEAALLEAERRTRFNLEHAEEQTRRHTTELAGALSEAQNAMRQAQEAMQSERAARLREAEAREREIKAFRDLERVKNLSVALHHAVLPEVPSEIANGRVHLGARYAPAERDSHIGGDFYDVLPIGDGSRYFGLAIGDVAGHGVEAAAQTALVTTTLRAYALEGADSPAEVMSRVARAIDAQLDSFVSLFFGVLDTETGRLVYCNAGHEPPIILTADNPNHPLALQSTGVILGVGIMDFEESQYFLNPGDAIVMLTDGLTEARAESGLLLGWEGVAAMAANRYQQTLDMQSLADTILRDVREFATRVRLADDVALLVARYGEPR